MNGIIYALVDPRDESIRYIGLTRNPKGRLYQHLKDNAVSPKTKWISELKALGLCPTMQTLESVTESELSECEKKWIAHGLEQGFMLTNLKHGGAGRLSIKAEIFPSKKLESLINKLRGHVPPYVMQSLEALPDRERFEETMRIVSVFADKMLEYYRGNHPITEYNQIVRWDESQDTSNAG